MALRKSSSTAAAHEEVVLPHSAATTIEGADVIAAAHEKALAVRIDQVLPVRAEVDEALGPRAGEFEPGLLRPGILGPAPPPQGRPARLSSRR